MRSACAVLPDGGVGTSIRASRWPLVATIRIRSGRSSQSTPFRIGRLSSVLAAKATCAISFCRSFDDVRQLPSNLTVGNAGNSSRGRPRSRNLERPHSIVTRCSPEAVSRMAALGSSRTISTSLRAGNVIAPS